MAVVRSSATAKAATAIVLGMLLVTGVLVLTTGLEVQDFGPVIVYGVALTAVVALFVAPAKRSR